MSAVAPITNVCHTCRRELRDGESAWAEDFKVIDLSGGEVTFRNEVRYICEDCAEAEA